MIPSGWKEVGIFEAADIVSGQVDPRKPPYDQWPLVAPNHIEEGTGRLLPVSTAAHQQAISGKYTFAPGDVLYSKIRPYLRKAALPKFSGVCSADMYPLRPREILDAGFLLGLLLGKDFTEFAMSVSMRTGIPKINREEMAEFRFLLPPLAEQRKIAYVLSSLDESLAASQSVIDQLHVVRRAMIDELLRRGVPGKHGGYQETEIGRLPCAWTIKKLHEVSDVVDCKHRTPVYVADGYPVVRPRDVKERGIDLDACASTTEAELLDLTEKCRPTVDSIIYSRNATFGVAALVRTTRSFAIGQDVCLIVPRSVFPPFLHVALNAPIVRTQLGLVSSGSTFQRINLANIRSLQIPVPPLEEQEAIAMAYAAIIRRIEADEKFQRHLSEARTDLLTALLTGEIRVPLSPSETAAP